MSTSSIVSRRYAKAIVETAKSDEEVDTFSSELSTFCEAFDESADLRNVLTNPTFGQEERTKTVNAIFEKLEASIIIQRYVHLLVKRGRASELPAIAADVRTMADERAKRIRARVESAFPLSEDTKDSLKRALGKRTGMTVELDVEVDPALIGGIRTSVGSLVFDGTLQTQIASLRKQLQSHA